MRGCVQIFGPNGLAFQEAIKQTEREGKWDKRVMYYDVINKCRTMTEKQVKKALNLAMTTWDIEINIEFRPVWFNNDLHKAEIRLDFADGTSEYFKNRPSVLALAYYPEQGDVSGLIVFNNDYIWSLNGDPITVKEARKRGYTVFGTPPDDQELKTYNIIHTLIHELGHMLGLSHDETLGTSDVMDAFYNGKMELSDQDLYRIRLKYNARIFSRWARYARLKKAIKRMKARL